MGNLGKPPSLKEQAVILEKRLSWRNDITPPTLHELMRILGKPPLQPEQISIVQRLLSLRGDIKLPSVQELPEILEKPPSVEEQIEILQRFLSLRGGMKLPPQRGKIKGKIFKSVVHAVLFVGRLKSSGK